MPISFVTAGLAAGAALAVLPVILHLFMRQTPKHTVFPALRLIRERQRRTQQRLRVKNWLLLLARMALVALMALALARPRVASQTTLGDQEVPTAMAFVFDTSLSMGYEERDRTRLKEAQEHALAILRKAHESSRVFIIDSADPSIVPLSPAAARKRIEALAIRPANRPLNAAVGRAYRAVADRALDLPRREVYILTDLAASAWDVGHPVEGLELADKAEEGVATYILRLTPEGAEDVAVVAAEPAASVATQDEQVPVRVRLRASGRPARRVAELFVDGSKRAQKPVDLPADGEVELELLTPKLAPGLHRGRVQLTGGDDPLEADDVRRFTLDVRPALRVLVAAEQALDAFWVAEALDPTVRAPGLPRPFRVDRVVGTRAVEQKLLGSLKEYACIFLLNVRSVDDARWSRLTLYVREGGGLVVGAGDRVRPESYNTAIASALLPASLGAVKDTGTGTFTFGRVAQDHPLFRDHTAELLADLTGAPIFKYLVAGPAKDARPILWYQDGQPALLERVFAGQRAGKVLLWTTALSRRPGVRSPASWNDWPASGWSFFVLTTRTVPYLAGLSGLRLTYDAGEDVNLPIDPSRRFNSFSVQAPGAKLSEPLGEPVSNANLVIVSAAQVGDWTVTASGPGGAGETLGFSVNPPADEARLMPLEKPQLDALFPGEGRYDLADDAESLNRVVKTARVGREVFPWIMLLILLLITAENALANRFYRERTAAAGPSPAGPGRAAA